MRVGLFDPYLDTLGGGERYILSIASVLATDHKVSLFWDDKEILAKASSKFNLSLERVTIEKNIFSPLVSTATRLIDSLSYDLIFYISDGSIPTLLSRSVIPVMQYPIHGHDVKGIKAEIKLLNTKCILCYSDFIKRFLIREHRKPVHVLYPPVRKIPQRLTKEKIILSVGRFTKGKNTKKQEFLINFFTLHNKLHFKGWKLVLIGSVLEEDLDYVAELRKKTEKNESIEIVVDASYATLSRYYAKARIYWHAAGVGEDVENYPERVEHFGISVVEAMSAGCVPVVYAAGGPKEIVMDDKSGFLFSDSSELFRKSKLLMNDARVWQRLSDAAIVRAEDFSPEKFSYRLKELI